MANRSKAEVEQELKGCGLEVIELQKDISELEQQREGPDAPADLEDQVRRKSDALKDAQARWDALKAEADSPA
jgi:hypothetical protein